ncbi:MAG: metallophosphoesterase family protein [Gammaproteobacteria bacterium]|nr:metallophosphoesterase family protein [Gammaproteobacteria bacterium]
MPSSTRVAILSDTHGILDPRVAELVARSDVAVHAGDIGGRGVLDALAEALAPRRGALVAVRGNNDVPEKWPREDHPVLESLPWEASLSLPGGELVVVHGHGYGYPGREHARMRRDYAHARVIVYGHSHLQCADREALPWVLNPGAAGRVRTHGGPSCWLLYASPRRWRLERRRFAPASAARGG